jgi:hypothetical protein
MMNYRSRVRAVVDVSLTPSRQVVVVKCRSPLYSRVASEAAVVILSYQ